MSEEKKKITFTVPAILSSISHTKDGGLRTGFLTNELKPEEKYIIISQMQKFGWLLFRSNPIQQTDVPLIQAEDKNKTPSKRLWAVLFRLYKQEGSNEDFDLYYRKKMEKMIDFVKAKLD